MLPLLPADEAATVVQVACEDRTDAASCTAAATNTTLQAILFTVQPHPREYEHAQTHGPKTMRINFSKFRNCANNGRTHSCKPQ